MNAFCRHIVALTLCLTSPALQAQGSTGTFIENRGQWSASTLYATCGGSFRVGLERGGVCFALLGADEGRGHVVRLDLDAQATPTPSQPLGEVFHFLRGRDRDGWVTHVPGYGTAIYEDALPGGHHVEITRGGAGRMHLLARSAGGAFTLPFSGVEQVTVRPDGSVRLGTSVGDLVLSAPTVRSGDEASPARWTSDGARIRLDPASQAGTGLPYEVTWSTFLGGMSGTETAWDVAEGADGSVTVCGATNSDDFPITPGAFDDSYEGFPWGTAFVTRFTADGSQLVYSTFVGGSGPDTSRCLVLAPDGDAIVAGDSASTDFPVTPEAWDDTPDLGQDGFVLRLNATGTDLVFSTFLGSDGVNPPGPGSESGYDEIWAVALDTDDTIVVAGFTKSPNFPVTLGAFQAVAASPSNSEDGFVARLDATGTQLLAATYLGGGPFEFNGGPDWMRDMAVRPDGSIVVAGWTRSPSFPVTPGAYAESHADPSFWDGFVSCLTPDLSALVFSTYLGGTGSDRLEALALSPDGAIVVAGVTLSDDFPTTPDAWSDTPANDDAFVSHLSSDGSTLLYSTRFGGGLDECLPIGVAVDASGGVVLSGVTESFTLPVTPGALQAEKGDAPLTIKTEGYLARFHPVTHDLLYSTYLGGEDDDIGLGTSDGHDMNLTADGDALIVGFSASPSFPTTPGSWQPELNEETHDAVVVKLVTLPTGAVRYGDGSPGAIGEPAIGVLAMPWLGNDGFGLTCTAAPPSSMGWLAVSTAPLAGPGATAGLPLWIDPAQLLALAPVTTTPLGWTQSRIAIPDDPALLGAEAYAQYLWPGHPDEAAASAALHLTVQAAP